jgi:SAM-dependent methyltransferase
MKKAYRLVHGPAAAAAPKSTEFARAALRDPRWPALAVEIAGLRNRDRHTLRIVDVDCGAGCLLLHALYYARNLGFVAIEGRGISRSPFLIKRAQAAARLQWDPAVGSVFEVADMIEALHEEEDFPADIVLWHGAADRGLYDVALVALANAGNIVIGDPVRGAA